MGHHNIESPVLRVGPTKRRSGASYPFLLLSHSGLAECSDLLTNHNHALEAHFGEGGVRGEERAIGIMMVGLTEGGCCVVSRR